MDDSLKCLEKFNTENTSLLDSLIQLENQMDKIEFRNLMNLSQNEIEFKSIETALTNKQTVLNLLKSTLNAYVNISDLFSKNLQLFYTKIKNSKLKRLSTDYLSDLTYLTSSYQSTEQKYQDLCLKCEQNLEKIQKSKELEIQISKLENWLRDMENKIEHESKRIAFITNSNDLHKVKELEDLCDKFKSFKSDLKIEKKV